MSFKNRRLAAACLSVTFLICGCGPSGPVSYPISGIVKFSGQPVGEGKVVFYNPKVGSSGVPLKTDGTYDFATVGGLQALDYQVYVEPPQQFTTPPQKGGPPMDKPKEYPNIPAKYRQAASSDLKYTVSGAKKGVEFEMKP
jgi:hypothetical protein